MEEGEDKGEDEDEERRWKQKLEEVVEAEVTERGGGGRGKRGINHRV